MGAETFSHKSSGKSAEEAFRTAVERAAYDHGHSGYTGTIAEKSDFIMLTPSPELIAQIKSVNWYDYDDEDPHWQAVDDKWGPAGCFDLGDGEYLFFGWASS